MADFSVEDFCDNPSWDTFEKCKKNELLMIASQFRLNVSANIRKAEMQRVLGRQLVDAGVLHARGGESEAAALQKDALEPQGASGVLDGDRKSAAGSLTGMTAEDLRLTLAIREAEGRNRELEVQTMHLRLRVLELERSPPPGTPVPSHSASASAASFDMSKHIALVPQFRESEVDSYFSAFERIAAALNWPTEFWSLLLQCKLVGKAQDVCASLSIEQSLDYETLKKAVLCAYELVPEAYRQRFRNREKNTNQTYVEFCREKSALFDKWCQACKINSLEEMRELILIEEFKKCLPERIVIYLNEQKVSSVTKAAVLADEFILTHKSVFPMQSSRCQNNVYELRNRNRSPRLARKTVPTGAQDSRECFYCKEPGHLIAVCPSLRKKEQSKPSKPAGVCLIKTVSSPELFSAPPKAAMLDVDSRFEPFVTQGFVSVTGEEKEKAPINILRDTAAYQSVMLRDVLPLSDETSCDADVLMWGIGMTVMRVPLHMVHLQSPLVSGPVKVAVCPRLPVSGVSFILGNDLAGGNVFPSPVVADDPIPVSSMAAPADPSVPSLFPVCAVTRAQARKLGDVVDLSDSFMTTVDENVKSNIFENIVKSENEIKSKNELCLFPSDAELTLNVTREMLITAQRNDKTLTSCLSSASAGVNTFPVFFFEDGVLMRKWSPEADELQAVHQVVVPKEYRPQVLSIAHDSCLAGHLGIKKTYFRVLRHFFWPGLKSDVAKYCRSCHTCQLAGKPNQPVPPAPLKPIPVLGEPFERVILDCVGPLPKTKAGHQYILTIMCAATRFPHAVPLRSLRTKPVVKALLWFFSTFGLPREIQTDRGTNFMSKLFSQVVKELNIKHVTSSAYHPESQGALERFHQTLKSMLRKFCSESEKEWDEGLPLLMFAIRETPQESLGFSPCDLVFGHTVRGPLRVLREKWTSDSPRRESNVLDYVSSFRERLHHVCQLAQENLTQAQSKMKTRFDKQSVVRVFQPDDKVLVLLPLRGGSLQCRFAGPYVVERKLSDTNYVIKTPDRQKKTRMCHINMLKRYFSREDPPMAPPEVPVVVVCEAVPQYTVSHDGLREKNGLLPVTRLQNSEVLSDLESFLSYLDESAKTDIIKLIEDNLNIFSDHPHQTSVLSHDIDVQGNLPIKQHAYRVNLTKRALMKSEVSYLLEHGLAVPSVSAWSSPCVLVPKPDKTARFCNDYRKVNAVTKPDSYPLPRMEDCIDRVGSARYVTKLDLLKGYWQVPLTPRASEISAFVTPDSFLQYTVMPFGLRNAPATFQRLMSRVLAGIDNCEAYLDDVVAYSTTWVEHVATLSLIFTRLSAASLTLNLAKCEFGKGKVTYLGKQVGQGQVRTVAAKVQAVIDFPAPQSKRALRRFLGMCGYYRGFCRNFSEVVAPLTALVSPLKNFVWSPECQTSFESAKALLCSSPVLAAPNFDRPFKLEVDASMWGAGAVLLQTDENEVDHPICYFSKKFNKHQVHYSTIEKEALAMLLALQNFEVYVGSSSQPVQVFTDHNPLVFLSRMRNSNQRLMRWSLLLQDFNVNILHKKGTENVLADALSRSSLN
uniref:Gypsy retrotransposon integrase-like protein 1 n=1 Tax=Gouania willdenowi TaxID=441366 RepID=A0A8C5DT92_GOUWI